MEGPDIKVLDAFAVLVDEQGRMQSAYSQDMLHLSTAGYEALSKELVKTLEAVND